MRSLPVVRLLTLGLTLGLYATPNAVLGQTLSPVPTMGSSYASTSGRERLRSLAPRQTPGVGQTLWSILPAGCGR